MSSENWTHWVIKRVIKPWCFGIWGSEDIWEELEGARNMIKIHYMYIHVSQEAGKNIMLKIINPCADEATDEARTS